MLIDRLLAPTSAHPSALLGSGCSVRGLRVFVAECGDLLPALPVFMRDERGTWEHVGDAIDRPEQLRGSGRAPWTHLTSLDLRTVGEETVLTGVAEPGSRPFRLTSNDPLARWSDVTWLDPSSHPVAPHSTSAPDQPRDDPSAPARIDWIEFDGSELDFRWRGTTWPQHGWSGSDADGLRVQTRAAEPEPVFLGLLVRHLQFAASTVIDLPRDNTDVEAGLMIRGDRPSPLSIGVRRRRPDRVDVVHRWEDGVEVLRTVRGEATSTVLSVQAEAGTITVDVRVGGGRPTQHSFAAPQPLNCSTVGVYATTSRAPQQSAGFANFEYRGQEERSC